MSYIKTIKEGGSGFLIVPDEVTTDAELKFQDMKVLLALCAHAANATGRAAPAVESICERTGMARENVSRALSRLVEMHWITRERMGHGFTNVYHITVDARKQKIAEEQKALRKVTSKKRSAEEQSIHVEKIKAKIKSDSEKAQENHDKAMGKPEAHAESFGIEDMFENATAATAEELEIWTKAKVLEVGFSRQGPESIPPHVLAHYNFTESTFN